MAKLGNPALIASAIANTPQGQKAIGTAIDKASAASSAGFNIVKNVLYIGVAVGVGLYVYKKYINSFTRVSENKKYAPSKLNDGIALAKADSIYKAMYGIGNGFNSVKGNLMGLSHNDFIKVFNAFGNRQGAIPFSKEKNLIEWIQDEFSPSEIIQLRFIVPQFF